jgi:S-adenosylmethionine:tRNA ribosyltransferase-isomerase
VVVVNDAATIPGALRGSFRGEAIELRLAGWVAGEPHALLCVVFGSGDHHVRTEDRGPAPTLVAGDCVELGPGDALVVLAVDSSHPRLVKVQSAEGAKGTALELAYAYGRPVQYAYLREELSLYDVQTPFAAAPFAFEMPSAGWALSSDVLLSMQKRGVTLCALTHAAGLSSTGDAALDAALPLPEAYRVPAGTARAVLRAKKNGGRVVAVGTSVARALETVGRRGFAPGALAGITDLRLGPATSLAVVDALLTGLHEEGTSHFELLRAFAAPSALANVGAEARKGGMLGHEFGDALLVFAQPHVPAMQIRERP